MKLIEGDIFDGEWDGLAGGDFSIVKPILAFVESNFTKVEFHIYSLK